MIPCWRWDYGLCGTESDAVRFGQRHEEDVSLQDERHAPQITRVAGVGFNFTRHCVQRYGLDEVRQWYFEVWNEPNLSGFWSSTRDEYWKLYDAAAAGVKAVDSKLRIGGPATSKANWVAEMIEHCVQNDVPIDFVSTHLYPQDEYVEYEDREGSPHTLGEFFVDMVRGVQETVRNSALPDLEIHWTEWNTQSTDSTANITWGDNIYVDTLFGASFIAKNCLQPTRSATRFATGRRATSLKKPPYPAARSQTLMVWSRSMASLRRTVMLSARWRNCVVLACRHSSHPVLRRAAARARHEKAA
jgi:hypothetical protein